MRPEIHAHGLAPRTPLTHGTQSPSRGARWVLCAAAIVTAIAAWLHSGGLHDVIAWDEANYTIAAKEGILANAFQLGELSQLRHRHAPLMCYAVAASTAAFGNDEWAIRLPAVVISALSCGLLVLIAYDLSRGASVITRTATGVTAGLILATSPASIELAGVIQPHSFVVFFLLLNLWMLCRYLRDTRRGDAIAFGLSLAGQFVSMEYGPVILCLAIVVVLITRPSLLLGDARTSTRSPRRFATALLRVPRTMHRDLKTAALACLAATAVVWPAGVILLGIPFNFAWYLLYAANGHPILFRGQMTLHVPKYAYVYWYWEAHPLLLIAMIAAMLLIAIWAWRQRGPVAITLAVLTFGLAASVHASHIMQLCKSIFMIPPIALGGPLAAVWMWERWRSDRGRSAPSPIPLPLREGLGEGRGTDHNGRVITAVTRPSPSPSLRGRGVSTSLAAALSICLAIAAILGGRTAPMSREADPNQRLIAMCRTIAAQAKPGDAVLAQGWPMVRYLLHLKLNRADIEVHRYDPRNYEIDRLGDRLGAGAFHWAVIIGPAASAYRDCRVLARLHAAWTVVEDASLPGREYRLYHAPVGVSAAEDGRVVAADEKEDVTP